MLYREIKELLDRGELNPNEVYIIEDYPNFTIQLQAKDNTEMFAEGTTSNGDIVYFSFDDNLFNYSSERGYIYYLYREDINATTTFDSYQYSLHDSTNIDYNTFDGEKYSLPEVEIINCDNIILEYGNIGTIKNCSYLTIGNSNTGLNLIDSTGITIGDNNIIINCINVNDASIGNDNENIDLNSYTIVGCNNKQIVVQGSNTTVNNNCIDIQVSGMNEIDESKYVRINGDSRFNKISKANSIEITDSYTNEIESSQVVNIINTDNNIINTNSIELLNKNPFKQYFYTDSTRQVKDINEYLYNRADSQAVTLNTKLNKAPSAEVSKNEYFLINKVWEAVEDANFEVYNLEVIPNSKNDYTVVTGGGTYTHGDMARIYANVYNEDRMFSHWEFYDSEDNLLSSTNENPYIFKIEDNTRVFAVIKDRYE